MRKINKDAGDMPAEVPILAGSFALMIIGASALIQGAVFTGLIMTGIAAGLIWYALRPRYHRKPDWIGDPNLSREEKLARFNSLKPELANNPEDFPNKTD